MNPLERDKKVNEALSRLSDVDSLLLKPKLDSIDQVLDGTDAKAPRRIALLAHQELEQKIRNAPAEPTPYLELATIYRDQNRFKDALRVLDSGLGFNPDFDPMLELREDIALDFARRLCDEARRSYANQPSKDAELQAEGTERNLAQETINVCQQRLKRRPDEPTLYLRWGVALQALGRYEESIAPLEKAASYPPLRCESYLRLGKTFEALHRSLEALSHYRMAAFFRAPPASTEVREQSLRAGGDLAEKLQLIDAAVQFFEALIASKPQDIHALEKRLEAVRQLPP